MITQIKRLPVTPSRERPTQFSDESNAFLGALPDFGDEANQLATEVNDIASQVEMTAEEVFISAAQADLSKQAANQSALAAANSAQQALVAAEVSKWVAGTYIQGAVVWSPISYFTYRRTIPGSTSSATDPFLDETGWKRINLPSFTQTILNGVGPHQLYVGGHYLLKTPDAELVMPLQPGIGDEVRVSNFSGSKGAVLQRNGETFKGLAEDLVIDSVNMDYTFTKTENEGWI